MSVMIGYLQKINYGVNNVWWIIAKWVHILELLTALIVNLHIFPEVPRWQPNRENLELENQDICDILTSWYDACQQFG